jgi:catechol 2,3-dioxygenase-like lactoylglutathione lyase family enzyme
MITQVKMVSITVNDQEKAVEFYTQKLGFTLQTNESMGDDKGTRWIELALPNGLPCRMAEPYSIYIPHKALMPKSAALHP